MQEDQLKRTDLLHSKFLEVKFHSKNENLSLLFKCTNFSSCGNILILLEQEILNFFTPRNLESCLKGGMSPHLATLTEITGNVRPQRDKER